MPKSRSFILLVMLAALVAHAGMAKSDRKAQSVEANTVDKEVQELEARVKEIERENRPLPTKLEPSTTTADVLGVPEKSKNSRQKSGANSDSNDKGQAGASEPRSAPSAPGTSGIMEVIPTKTYVEFSELDPVPPEVIRWDRNSGKFLYISKNEAPFIFLFGTLREGYELSINNRWIATNNGRFETKVYLPLEPNNFTVKVFLRDRKFTVYRLVYSWVKYPPSIRFRVKEEKGVFEKIYGYSGKYARSAWIQLYSGGNPMPVVDIDAIKHLDLSFRIFNPPEPELVYDGWKITIRDSQNIIVGELKRFGAPPPFVDWAEINPRIYTRDEFSYQVDLFREDKVFRGKANHFETIEGFALLNHPGIPIVQFEPREELGYFNYIRPADGYHISNIYVGADLPFVFFNRLIARGTGWLALHTTDENSSMSFYRVGGGVRLLGSGESFIFGYPYIYRLDVYLNKANFTVTPTSSILRFSHPSVLIEPHFILWGVHYLVPWVEYGARLNLEEQRYSFGVNYYFYVQPWSIKLGIGFSYDHLFRFDADTSLQFSVFRTMGHMIFSL